MKFSKIAIVLGVIGMILILWIDYVVFTQLSQIDFGGQGDINPTMVSSGGSALFPFLLGLLALILSIAGIVKKEQYRFIALFLSLFTSVFAFSPTLILMLLI